MSHSGTWGFIIRALETPDDSVLSLGPLPSNAAVSRGVGVSVCDFWFWGSITYTWRSRLYYRRRSTCVAANSNVNHVVVILAVAAGWEWIKSGSRLQAALLHDEACEVVECRRPQSNLNCPHECDEWHDVKWTWFNSEHQKKTTQFMKCFQTKWVVENEKSSCA